MELNYPLVRVPFERASKHFRLYHKQLTRELAHAVAAIEELDNNQQPGHRMDAEAAINKLNELAQKLRNLKQSAKANVLQLQNDLESCSMRSRYLKTLEEVPNADNTLLQHLKQSINDRLVADYLLGQGYLESAKVIEDTKGIAHLVDHDLYAECKSILKDLKARHTASAIAWCSQNGTRLRRLQSSLDFQLRLQDFIELVRSRKPLEAVEYARTYLAPLAMQPEEQSLRDAAIGEVQIAMATLAFECPERCGIEAYEKVFTIDRWVALEKLFRKTFYDVYGMHDPPSLCIALHAGLSTLNTRTCQLARDAKMKRNKRDKRSRREDEDGKQENESGSESEEVWSRPILEKSDSSPTSSHCKKRKYTRAESSVPICPACSEVGSQLCAGLPFAYHPHSRLVCRVTQTVMDEHNPPLVLPNGRVYSKRGIELLTQRSSNGMIKCVDTQDVFSPADVKTVYIL